MSERCWSSSEMFQAFLNNDKFEVRRSKYGPCDIRPDSDFLLESLRYAEKWDQAIDSISVENWKKKEAVNGNYMKNIVKQVLLKKKRLTLKDLFDSIGRGKWGSWSGSLGIMAFFDDIMRYTFPSEERWHYISVQDIEIDLVEIVHDDSELKDFSEMHCDSDCPSRPILKKESRGFSKRKKLWKSEKEAANRVNLECAETVFGIDQCFASDREYSRAVLSTLSKDELLKCIKLCKSETVAKISTRQSTVPKTAHGIRAKVGDDICYNACGWCGKSCSGPELNWNCTEVKPELANLYDGVGITPTEVILKGSGCCIVRKDYPARFRGDGKIPEYSTFYAVDSATGGGVLGSYKFPSTINQQKHDGYSVRQREDGDPYDPDTWSNWGIYEKGNAESREMFEWLMEKKAEFDRIVDDEGREIFGGNMLMALDGSLDLSRKKFTAMRKSRGLPERSMSSTSIKDFECKMNIFKNYYYKDWFWFCIYFSHSRKMYMKVSIRFWNLGGGGGAPGTLQVEQEDHENHEKFIKNVSLGTEGHSNWLIFVDGACWRIEPQGGKKYYYICSAWDVVLDANYKDLIETSPDWCDIPGFKYKGVFGEANEWHEDFINSWDLGSLGFQDTNVDGTCWLWSIYVIILLNFNPNLGLDEMNVYLNRKLTDRLSKKIPGVGLREDRVKLLHPMLRNTIVLFVTYLSLFVDKWIAIYNPWSREKISNFMNFLAPANRSQRLLVQRRSRVRRVAIEKEERNNLLAVLLRLNNLPGIEDEDGDWILEKSAWKDYYNSDDWDSLKDFCKATTGVTISFTNIDNDDYDEHVVMMLGCFLFGGTNAFLRVHRSSINLEDLYKIERYGSSIWSPYNLVDRETDPSNALRIWRTEYEKLNYFYEAQTQPLLETDPWNLYDFKMSHPGSSTGLFFRIGILCLNRDYHERTMEVFKAYLTMLNITADDAKIKEVWAALARRYYN